MDREIPPEDCYNILLKIKIVTLLSISRVHFSGLVDCSRNMLLSKINNNEENLVQSQHKTEIKLKLNIRSMASIFNSGLLATLEHERHPFISV